MARPNLTPEALEGYAAAAGARCPYLATSNAAAAWHLGAYLRSSGRSTPRDVRPGRGYTMHANDSRWSLDWSPAGAPIVERIR